MIVSVAGKEKESPCEDRGDCKSCGYFVILINSKRTRIGRRIIPITVTIRNTTFFIFTIRRQRPKALQFPIKNGKRLSRAFSHPSYSVGCNATVKNGFLGEREKVRRFPQLASDSGKRSSGAKQRTTRQHKSVPRLPRRMFLPPHIVKQPLSSHKNGFLGEREGPSFPRKKAPRKKPRSPRLTCSRTATRSRRPRRGRVRRRERARRPRRAQRGSWPRRARRTRRCRRRFPHR